MISTRLLTIEFEEIDFTKEVENSLASNHYSFILKSTIRKKLFLLDAILKKGREEIDIVPEPIGSESGTIRIPLGHSDKVNFKVYFRVYATEVIPKVKAFIIDDTNKKIVRTEPTGKTTKKLKKKELWASKV